MRVVIDGPVRHPWTVPQNIVLGPLLFLCPINDIPSAVRSEVRHFADGCLLYREIHSQGRIQGIVYHLLTYLPAPYHIILQLDLQQFMETWQDSGR